MVVPGNPPQCGCQISFLFSAPPLLPFPESMEKGWFGEKGQRQIAKSIEKTEIMKPTKTLLYTPGQRDVVEKLRPIIQLATSPSRGNLKMSTRTNTLVTGPSGSGKSFLAKALAAEAGLPFWEANVSSWIVLGARNGSPTLASLCEWISTNSKGIIFIDELEKPFPHSPDGRGSGEWYTSVRMELHDLLDARMPLGGIQIDEVASTAVYKGLLSGNDCKNLVKIDVEAKLRESYMVIGAGTWQHLWTSNKNTLGFNCESTPINSLDQAELMKSISPEVLMRFRNQVLFLRPMTEKDYHHVLEERVGLVPVKYRKRFEELVLAAIPKALEFGLGMRVVEEVFTDLCVEILQNCTGDQEAFREIVLGYSRDQSI